MLILSKTLKNLKISCNTAVSGNQYDYLLEKNILLYTPLLNGETFVELGMFKMRS
jgi:hypothetical protein